MSKRGDCYDNAAIENWNQGFQVEAILGEEFATRATALAVIIDFIEVYYNRGGMHSALGYKTPQEYEDIFNLGLSRGHSHRETTCP